MAGAAISGGFGVVGGRIAARSMRNRTAPLQEFSFLPISETPARSLHIMFTSRIVLHIKQHLRTKRYHAAGAPPSLIGASGWNDCLCCCRMTEGTRALL
jgi:hypothetical protein